MAQKQMTYVWLVVLILSLIHVASHAAAMSGEAMRGKSKSATCTACHGPAGVSANPLWPNLAGQKADYMVKQLEAFQKGDRKDPLMTPVTQTLSREDFKELAAYFATLK